jgi:hypothetical protein
MCDRINPNAKAVSIPKGQELLQYYTFGLDDPASLHQAIARPPWRMPHTGEWCIRCDCGAHWTAATSKTVEFVMETFRAHRYSSEKAPMVTL